MTCRTPPKTRHTQPPAGALCCRDGASNEKGPDRHFPGRELIKRAPPCNGAKVSAAPGFAAVCAGRRLAPTSISTGLSCDGRAHFWRWASFWVGNAQPVSCKHVTDASGRIYVPEYLAERYLGETEFLKNPGMIQIVESVDEKCPSLQMLGVVIPRPTSTKVLKDVPFVGAFLCKSSEFSLVESEWKR